MNNLREYDRVGPMTCLWRAGRRIVKGTLALRASPHPHWNHFSDWLISRMVHALIANHVARPRPSFVLRYSVLSNFPRVTTCAYVRIYVRVSTHTHTHVRMYAVGKRIFLARTKTPLFLVVLRCARRKTYVKLPFHRRNQFIFKFPRCEEYTS